MLDFNEKLKNLDPAQFVKSILVDTIGVKKLVVGYDHAFGRNRSGRIAELKKLGQQYGFDVEVCGPVLVDDQPVSSSRIRRALLQNRFDEALRLLGHGYSICGVVERGIGLGKKLGYPTANIRYNPRKLLPAQGVYVCRALIDEKCHEGLMFIGRNHFNPEVRISVEAHLFNFDRELYGEEMIVYPTRFIRENRRYDTHEKLARQIDKDKEKALQILQKEKQHVAGQRAKSSHYC
ncbi:MAG: riboflavin kinase [Candidatus Zixiibacteriota bacterium]